MRVPLTSHYATNSADAALWHAEHDGGLTFALSYQVVDAVKAGRLRIVLEAFEPASAADSLRLSVLAPAVREGTHVRRTGRGHLRLAVLNGAADCAVHEA